MEKKNFSAEKLQPVMQKLERLHEYLAKRSKKRRLTGMFSSPATSKMAGH
jgi:hypothetical protein